MNSVHLFGRFNLKLVSCCCSYFTEKINVNLTLLKYLFIATLINKPIYLPKRSAKSKKMFALRYVVSINKLYH